MMMMMMMMMMMIYYIWEGKNRENWLAACNGRINLSTSHKGNSNTKGLLHVERSALSSYVTSFGIQ